MNNLRFFLTSSQMIKISLFTLFIFLISNYISFLFYLLIVLCALYLHRKKPTIRTERQLNSNELIYSPVNGIIKEVTGDLVIIKTSVIDEGGIYAPFKCEVLSFNKAEPYAIKLNNADENSLNLKFSKNLSFLKPKFWIENMDRAKCGASIGFNIFGAVTEISLKGNFEIVAKVGNKVKASQTIIAHFKDTYE